MSRNIKDLNSIEYARYIATTDHIEASHDRTWWIFSIMLMAIVVTSYIKGLTLAGIVLIVLCVAMLILNWVATITKYKHVHKLFGLSRGFSLLN